MHVIIRSPTKNHNENDSLDHAVNIFINQKCKNDLDDQISYFKSCFTTALCNEICPSMYFLFSSLLVGHLDMKWKAFFIEQNVTTVTTL